jgi:hypothetical protein
MTTLNKNTKKAQGFLQSREWAKSKGNYSIFSVYDRPSNIKVNIAKEIEQRLTDVVYHNGNSFAFTCSGYDKDNNLIVETKSSTYKILL